MDIQELNQFESVYQPSKEVAFCWGMRKYAQLSTGEDHTDIVDHANDSLRIWQAAKAQAVPDGLKKFCNEHKDPAWRGRLTEYDKGYSDCCIAVLEMIEA